MRVVTTGGPPASTRHRSVVLQELHVGPPAADFDPQRSNARRAEPEVVRSVVYAAALALPRHEAWIWAEEETNP